MAFQKQPAPPPPAVKAFHVELHVRTTLDENGNVVPAGGTVHYSLVDANGEVRHTDTAPALPELTNAQKTSLLSIMNALRTKINAEAI